jgi:serine/threonine-protein kinase PRP4
MDMWSVGCVLYELFTGKILFPGRSNNEMLKLMMDVKGPFPKKMLKKGIFVEKHFEDDTSMSFALVEEDPVTKQPVSDKVAVLYMCGCVVAQFCIR